MTAMLLYLALALGVSFLCSLAEAGLLSLRQSDIARLVRAGKPSGPLLERMKANIDRPLAAILTLNTIANTVGAAGVGAQALKTWGDGWVAIASGTLTLLILIFSEIIPKTIGTAYCHRLAPPVAYIVKFMILLTYPLIVVLQGISRIFAGSEPTRRTTMDDLTLMAEVGRKEGSLDHKEYDVIRNLHAIADMPVSDIMTPRRVVQFLDRTATVAEAMNQEGVRRFSRLPVQDDGPDHVVGIVLKQDLYETLRRGKPQTPISDLVKPIHAIPETATVGNTLREHVKRREHLFLVVDEYGGTAGVVTLEDSMESLIGEEIVDETDAVTDMRKLGERIAKGRLNPRERSE
ncbi:MAG: hemolysin family protein [Phycisphaerae bacterium]